jgi:RIO-like serine/threonine protein kinase
MTEDELRVLRAIKVETPKNGLAPLQAVAERSGLHEGKVLRIARGLEDQDLIMTSIAGGMALTITGEGEVVDG